MKFCETCGNYILENYKNEYKTVFGFTICSNCLKIFDQRDFEELKYRRYFENPMKSKQEVEE